MKKELLLISDTQSFMVNAIRAGLARSGYLVTSVSAIVTEISKVENPPRIWVLYLDTIPKEINSVLTYIYEAITEDDIFFYPIGNSQELDAVRDIIPESCIAKSFLRPLNVKELEIEMEDAFDRGIQAEDKRKLLIVDDDTTMLKTLKKILSAHYHVFVVNSGMNAIAFLSKNEVDLVLLDYEMPVVSGVKILEMMRSESATESIPVMFLTGKSDRESVMSTVPLHPEKYLLKSLSSEELLAAIDEYFLTHKKH